MGAPKPEKCGRFHKTIATAMTGTEAEAKKEGETASGRIGEITYPGHNTRITGTGRTINSETRDGSQAGADTQKTSVKRGNP